MCNSYMSIHQKYCHFLNATCANTIIITHYITIITVLNQHTPCPISESKCNCKGKKTLIQIEIEWFARNGRSVPGGIQVITTEISITALSPSVKLMSFSMQVPALILDCEPDIDFSKDIEAKRQ